MRKGPGVDADPLRKVRKGAGLGAEIVRKVRNRLEPVKSERSDARSPKSSCGSSAGLEAQLTFSGAELYGDVGFVTASLFLVPEMVLGELLGRIARVSPPERLAYVVELGFRNLGLAIVVTLGPQESTWR